MTRRLIFALGVALVCAGVPPRLVAAASIADDGGAQPCATAEACLAQLDHLKNDVRSERTIGLTLDGAARGLTSRAVFLGGKTVLPRLTRLLSAKNDSVARAAAEALGAAGKDAALAFPVLARELLVRRPTVQGRSDFNRAIPWALHTIDDKRATPWLKAACQRGNPYAARVLLDGDPDSFRAVLASANPGKAVELLTNESSLAQLEPFLDEETRVPYLELAAKNPKLPAKLKREVGDLLADRARSSWRTDPVAAMAEIDRLLADTEMNAIDPLRADRYSDAFRVVARAAKEAAPLVPRLIALAAGKPVVAARATWTLGEIPDPAARAAVRSALGSNDWRVLLVAANALGRQGGDAKDAELLGKLGQSHWHPAVRTTAKAASAAVTGKGPRPAPLESPAEPGANSPGHAWGGVHEPLGTGFRCAGLPAWGKPAATQCPMPGEPDQTTLCTSVQRLDSGWLRVEQHGRQEGGVSQPRKAKLEFVPKRGPGAHPVATVTEGYIAGVTGAGARATAVETERSIDSQAAAGGLGPGRTWLSVFEHGTGWTAQPPVELPAGLATVERLPDGALLLGFPNSQLVLRVGPDGRIGAGDCQPDPLAGPPQWAGMLQAVLDEPAFAARITTGGVPLPLHISFDFPAPPEVEQLRFGGQAIVVEQEARTIAAGRTLEIWEAAREYRDADRAWVSAPTDAMTLSVDYPVLQLERRFRLGVNQSPQGAQAGWKVLAAAKPPAPTTAPPPANVKAPPRDAALSDSGVAWKTLTTATDGLFDGDAPRPSSVVTVDVTAWTADGQLYFPTTGKAPARVELPLALALGGLGEAIATMKTTESRRLWIPSRVAFATPPAGQQDLVMDVRLIGIAEEEQEDLFLSTADEIDQRTRPPRDLAKAPAGAQTAVSGIAWRLLETGKARPVAVTGGELAVLKYKGWTADGSLFDSGSLGRANQRGVIERGTALPLLIPGLAEGVRQMSPGNRYRLWVPAALAYGKEPRLPDVPAGPLVLDVELVAGP